MTRARLFRFLATLPVMTLVWTTLTLLPTGPNGGRGHLVTHTTVLTGSHGVLIRAIGGSGRRRTTGAAEPGWSAEVSVDAHTQLVDLTWHGAPNGTVELRSRHQGRWSAWSEQQADPDEGPDRGGNGRTGVGPLWLGHDGVDAVQARVTSGSLHDLTLDSMSWEQPTGGGDVAGAEPAGPAIHPRSEWAPGGWRADNPGCTPAPVAMDALKFAVVHHTVNSNDYGPDDVPALLASIYRYHTDSLGWCDIAYNFLIDRFGGAWQGRSGDINAPIMGGHAKGFNTDSVGVAFLGQYQPGVSPAAAAPTTAALGALRELLAWKLGAHLVNPQGTVTVRSFGSTRYPEGTVVTIPTIIGHRDVGLTACPGDYVYTQLASIRSQVAQVIAATATPARWSPFQTPQAAVSQDAADLLRRAATNGEMGTWSSRVVRDGMRLTDVATSLLVSSEADQRVGSVIRLYLADFLRRPDSGGLQYWLQRRANGTTLTSISDYFASSSEFRLRYGTLTDTDFVRQVYLNVMGREPDSGGLSYWTGRLHDGLSRGSLVLAFSESSEFRRLHRSEVMVTMAYAGLLRSMPPDSAYAYWIPRFDAGEPPTALVTALLGSTTYSSRFS